MASDIIKQLDGTLKALLAVAESALSAGVITHEEFIDVENAFEDAEHGLAILRHVIGGGEMEA